MLSITSVSRVAGERSSTASWASLYCAPSIMSAHSTSSSRSGAIEPKLSRATVQMYLVQERKLGSNIFRPLVSLLKMLGVFGRQEGALMMVEPPGQARIGGVLEIDNRVHVAVEISGLKQLVGLVGEPGERELGAGIEIGLRQSG